MSPEEDGVESAAGVSRWISTSGKVVSETRMPGINHHVAGAILGGSHFFRMNQLSGQSSDLAPIESSTTHTQFGQLGQHSTTAVMARRMHPRSSGAADSQVQSNAEGDGRPICGDILADHPISQWYRRNP